MEHYELYLETFVLGETAVRESYEIFSNVALLSKITLIELYEL